MIVDGKKIAESIKAEVKVAVKALSQQPRLLVVSCAPNLETSTYLELKERIAHDLGIVLEKKIFPAGTDTQEILSYLEAETDNYTGVLVQLPLPSPVATNQVLWAVPKEKDVDAFMYVYEDTPVLPPVVAAIATIAEQYAVSWMGKRVVIFGAGRLVGAPTRRYAESQGAIVMVCDEHTANVKELTLSADIIVLGVGKSGLLTTDMVREGVIVFDAGASEDGGVLVGDADPEVALKAAIFTPVPGGIGPITVAVLFRNLLTLALRQ